ncbi:hypothetical protein MKW98_024857 [Papaver atlanticum]|uniref:Uncharacterized protein n=1 Tax=Papaver atlanticum TaxID=357466 RepID=A0AAD4XRP1_9MAGN|nr:hypothetical protein MKW98_024857 [Papaver atlanticum]
MQTLKEACKLELGDLKGGSLDAVFLTRNGKDNVKALFRQGQKWLRSLCRALGPIALLLMWSIVSGRSCRGQGRNRKGNMAKLGEWFRKKFLQCDRCLLAFGNTIHVLCSIIEETLVEKMNSLDKIRQTLLSLKQERYARARGMGKNSDES